MIGCRRHAGHRPAPRRARDWARCGRSSSARPRPQARPTGRRAPDGPRAVPRRRRSRARPRCGNGTGAAHSSRRRSAGCRVRARTRPRPCARCSAPSGRGVARERNASSGRRPRWLSKMSTGDWRGLPDGALQAPGHALGGAHDPLPGAVAESPTVRRRRDVEGQDGECGSQPYPCGGSSIAVCIGLLPTAVHLHAPPGA